MKKVSLVVHQNYVEDVIKKLHETGLMEIINIAKDEPEFLEENEKAIALHDAEICANYDLRISRLIDILSKLRKRPSGIKAMLKPQLPEIKNIEDSTLEEICSYAEGVLGNIEKNILNHEEKIRELDEKIVNINSNIYKLEFVKDFNFDVSDIGQSDYVIVKVGKTLDYPNLKIELDKLEKVVWENKQFGTKKKIEWSVLIAAHISEKEKIEKICREYLLDFDFEDLAGSPKELIKSLKKEKEEIEKEKKKIRNDLKIYADEQLDDLLATREEIQLEGVRQEISRNFAKTNTTYIIKGWVIEKDEEDLKKSIETVSDGHIIYDSKVPSANPDDPPVYFKTPRWAQGFKDLLGMFALPRYNEINPTVIMGIFFILFFGLMLGDAGYGLVLLTLSLYGYYKLGKHSTMFRNWSFMGIWMGIVTTVVGILTNSFFGDFIPRFFYEDPGAPLYSLNIAGIHLPADPIGDPLTILTIALFFGLVHLNVGVILGIYQSFKRKDYKDMLTGKLCWISLQLGGGMLIGKMLLGFDIPEQLQYIAAILVIIGIVQLFAHAGPIGFFDITGYVGDWLSYARLLALGLATAGMALAFNVIAQLMGNMIPIIGIVVMIIILIFAHMINLGLQALGAAIHSLRLQYVEFFNRFYEGGGKEFTPFKLRRRYTKLEEEKID